jgi:hypothetical protein
MGRWDRRNHTERLLPTYLKLGHPRAPKPNTIMTPTSSKNTRLTHSVFAALIINLSAVATVSAHPGHGMASDGDSAIHYLIEPTHGIGLGIIVLSTIAATFVLWRRNRELRNQTTI